MKTCTIIKDPYRPILNCCSNCYTHMNGDEKYCPECKAEVVDSKKEPDDLVGLAKKELEKAGYYSDEYGTMIADGIIELLTVFDKQGHSGFSASITRQLFMKLSNFEKL